MYESMLTLEDLNSILAFNPDFTEQYTIDTSLLPQNAFTDTYYDFNIISMTEDNGTYTYKLEVYNRMWDGGISFRNIPNGKDYPTVNTIPVKNDNNEYYMLNITTTYTNFEIILTLNNLNDNPREIIKTNFILKLSDTELKYPYYERKTFKITSNDGKGNSLSGTNLDVIGDGINLFGQTGSDGTYTFTLPYLEPGTYNLKVTGSKTGYNQLTTYLKVIVTKEVPEIIYTPNDAYKGGFSSTSLGLSLQGSTSNEFKIRVQCADNQYNTDITDTLLKKNSQLEYLYKENFRTIHKDTTVITVTIPETTYTEEVSEVFTKQLITKVISTWEDLKTECESDTGVDYIEIPQLSITAGTTINITRDIELYGQLGTGWPTFSNSTSNYLFKVYNDNLIYTNFNVQNIRFEANSNGVIYANNYSQLLISNCMFNHNKKQDNIGACIQNRIDSELGAGLLTQATITDCYFTNNKGSSIASSGKTSIDNCHFYLNDWDYAQHPQPYGLQVFYQDTTVSNSEFYLNMGTTESPLPLYQHSNFSWGKVPVYIQKNAILNGKKGSAMLKDNSSSLIADSNKSYLYARYQYDGVSSVASPVKGHERDASGHIISGRNWAWKDNIKVEKRSVYDNYYNPPSITLPANNKKGAS